MTKDQDWFQKYVDLSEAVRDLYYAAHWHPDRKCEAVKLWTAVRDAAGIEPGRTKEVLGEPRPPITLGL